MNSAKSGTRSCLNGQNIDQDTHKMQKIAHIDDFYIEIAVTASVIDLYYTNNENCLTYSVLKNRVDKYFGLDIPLNKIKKAILALDYNRYIYQ